MFKSKNLTRIFFSITTLALAFLFFVLLEISLRICSVGDDLRLFVESPEPKYLQCNTNVAKRYFSTFKHTTPLRDYFLKEKPANGYRIFVLGESTVMGFPYNSNVAFTRILQKRLQDIFPHRTIEVVNLGLTAISSYTLMDFAAELIEQKPDAVLIYTGHNEYYGAMGVASMESGSIPTWMKKLHLKFVRLRTYQLLQSGISSLMSIFASQSPEEAKGTLMQKVVGKNLIPYGSEAYREGVEQFSNNIAFLIEKLKNAGVQLIISDLVSNEKDLRPFYSLRYNEYPPADSVFLYAQQLESARRFQEARAEYWRAKDLDQIRFRASEDLNKEIVSIADSFGIPCVSLKILFGQNSPNGIVGNNLMTEHLHPNVDGYFLMAEGFLQAMREHGWIEQRWDTARIKPSSYYRQNWGFTELDSAIAAIQVQHLKSGWPFQPETTVNNFLFTYTPQGIIDSLAFLRVKYDNVSSEKVHKQLAEYYMENGDFKKASKEYLAAAYAFPMQTSAYYYAADCAAKAGDFENAIRYLTESPHSDTSSYVQTTLASLFLSQKKYGDALRSVEKLKAIGVSGKEKLMAMKLEYVALKDSGLTEQSQYVLALIRQIEPTFNERMALKTRGILIPSSIKKYLQEAEELRQAGDLDGALAKLRYANTIKEISFTNLQIGKILLAQKKAEALPYLEKAYKELKDDPPLLFALSILYIHKKDFSKAEKMMNEFKKLAGVNNPQYQQLKALYEKDKRLHQ